MGLRAASLLLRSELKSISDVRTIRRNLSTQTGALISGVFARNWSLKFQVKDCCCGQRKHLDNTQQAYHSDSSSSSHKANRQQKLSLSWSSSSPLKLIKEKNEPREDEEKEKSPLRSKKIVRISFYEKRKKRKRRKFEEFRSILAGNFEKRQPFLGHKSNPFKINKEHKKLYELSVDNLTLKYHPPLLYGSVADMDQAVERHKRAAVLYNQDRALKEEQARLVAPGTKQSPIAILSLNPTYELLNKPLIIEYPAIVDSLRLNNTGYSWEVKIPYQISIATTLFGAQLNSSYRYRLDQFHCHWGSNNDNGSEHTVDNRAYSAEIHFVHYNMEKYHNMSKAARHPDGLVVVSVFLDAQEDHHNHAELEKVVSHLRSVKFKSEHTIIKQTIRIENLLPAIKSYWSYQGSLTTPPYYESVTWFVLKQPIKCSINQINKFRDLSPMLEASSPPIPHITSNHRTTQPLNGRTIITYDEPSRHNNYR